MRQSDTRILTTHAGSLPRPQVLNTLYARRVRGVPFDERELEKEGRKAVSLVLKGQLEAGIDIVSNGEQQRESFVLYLRRRLSGIGGEGGRAGFADIDRYPKFKERYAAQAAASGIVTNRTHLPKCIGEIRYTGKAELDRECADFKAALAGDGASAAEPFFTAASPGILAAIVRNEHYPDMESYIGAVGGALQVEYETIVANGFTLQIDAPDLALEGHSSFHGRLPQFIGFIELVVSTINKALVNIPREKVRLHVCWGNYEGPHDCDVPLREILPALKTCKAGALFLPFANPRHAHEVKVLGEIGLNPDQLVIAGVIDTLTNFVEHPEVVADRIERVVEAVGDRERVLAGTDCGFDTSAGMGRVAEDVVWAKLAALSAGARIASGRL